MKAVSDVATAGLAAFIIDQVAIAVNNSLHHGRSPQIERHGRSPKMMLWARNQAAMRVRGYASELLLRERSREGSGPSR